MFEALFLRFLELSNNDFPNFSLEIHMLIFVYQKQSVFKVTAALNYIMY